MKAFQIHVERKNEGALRGLAGSLFGTYSATYGKGIYNNREVNVIVFTVIGGNWDTVRDFCDIVKVLNSQDAVLVAQTEVEQYFI